MTIGKKLNKDELMLLFQIHQKESTSFQLFPEVIRLIRQGEDCAIVLQRKFGLTVKEVEVLRGWRCPLDDFKGFINHLYKQGVLTSEEIKEYFDAPKGSSNTLWLFPAGLALLMIVVLYSFSNNESSADPLASDEKTENTKTLEETKKNSVETKETLITKTEIISEDMEEDPFLLGISAEKEGNLTLAIQHFKEKLKQQPEHFETYFQLGKILLAEKKYEDAHAYFTKLLDLKESKPKALVKKAYAAFLLNKLSEAEGFALKAKESVSQKKEALTILGQIQLAQGKKEEAIKALDKAVELGISDPEVLIILAEYYYKSKRPEKALGFLNDFLAQRPKEEAALKILGQIQLAQGEIELGIATLEKVLQDGKTDPQILMVLTKAYQKNQQFPLALKTLEAYIALEGKEAVVINFQGELLEQNGDFETALKKFEEACALKKDFLRAQLNRAILLQEKGELKEALNVYSYCLELDPNSVLAHYNRALLLLQTKKEEEAEKEFLALIQKFPKDPIAFEASMVSGSYFYSVKNYEKAEKFFGQALQISGKNEEALLRHGMSALKLKQYSKAVFDFETLLQINPEHPKKELFYRVISSLKAKK